jgi:hypothetical protein
LVQSIVASHQSFSCVFYACCVGSLKIRIAQLACDMVVAERTTTCIRCLAPQSFYCFRCSRLLSLCDSVRTIGDACGQAGAHAYETSRIAVAKLWFWLILLRSRSIELFSSELTSTRRSHSGRFCILPFQKLTNASSEKQPAHVEQPVTLHLSVRPV